MGISDVRAVVDLDVPGAVISRHLYGHFAEHLGHCIYGGFWVGEDSPVPNVGGIRSDVVAALRALEIPNLRWPGGCFADEYHWRDGVGPRRERPRMVNTHWGNVEENNHFGTHEFMALCDLLGAEAYVNGNLGSGTVREMSEWVEYLTRDGDSSMVALRRANGRQEPWRVRFWGLGNEAWGCGGGMRPEAYADLARRYGTFCRDYDGNRLYRIAAGAPDDDLTWTRALMEAVSCLGCRPSGRPPFQAISFHYYTHSGEGLSSASATEFTPEQYYRTMANAADIDRVIAAHSAVMDAYDPDRTVGLVCDEWGTWWQVEPGTNPGFLRQQNTMRDALVAAVHFDIFHKHAERLAMANIAQTVNVLQSMIMTDDRDEMVLTPSYHVFEMNKGHHEARRLPVYVLDAPTRSVDDQQLSTISMSASTKNERALISVSNVDLSEHAEVRLDLRGRGVADTAGRILTGASANSHNATDAGSSVAPVPLEVTIEGGALRLTLPPHSFATVSARLE